MTGFMSTAKSTKQLRKNILGPFSVQNQADCELACNCARGDASGQACAQFSGVIQPVNCHIYYYTASWCSFLGDYTVNTCILPIVEYQLQQVQFFLQREITEPFTTTTTLPTTATTTSTPALTPSTLPTTFTSTTTELPTTTVTGSWSEWVTTGVCATTCGSCSNATRTRTCTGGPCEGGASDDVGPCGISMCSFPATTCCFSLKKTLNSKTNAFYCGPGGTYP
ncbi:hypothetical protein PRIPAC_88405 [Pristionchus pacificus]|uniref:Uncharacterized protein n=1 Tax=Pristionchus pacificus TaxID=54126 RepID=A0A2A6B656_PRIPA|nr:hypothetical protein PRIPAC_88405 [Pristionchus pacificus]|eukprot:PDM61357.1 hypothetical protein PRIPAC_50799 [Pristionchus pacificus]